MKNFTVLCLLFINLLFASSIKDDTEAIIREKMGSSITLEFIMFEIPKVLKKEIETESQQKFYGDFVYIYKVFENAEFKNIAVVDNVLGKSMPITVLVIYDLNGTINYSGIVKYREQYGGGVKSEDWNKQFKGKNSKSGYIVGTDISAISGATISAHSVTRGIKKITLLVDKIKDTL